MNALTEEQIDLIQASFAEVRPISVEAARLFYARLFDIAPEVEPMFRGDMADQGAKLMATLGVVVSGLRNLGELMPTAADLAARHVTYGVTPRHYTPVGEALIWTLEQGLGETFTPAHRTAWETAYAILSTAMVASAYPRADHSGIVAAE
jgi:nitric oxide dioxygenase